MTEKEEKTKDGEEMKVVEVSQPDGGATTAKVSTPEPTTLKEESPAEEVAEEVEVPKEFEKIVAEIESMSVLQLHELVKVLEKKFGVSAAAMAVAGPSAEAAEEKTEFNAELKSFGESKIGVIKAVKAVLGLGLKEAKDLVEAAPTMLKEKMPKEDAEALKTAIEDAGGTVELN